MSNDRPTGRDDRRSRLAAAVLTAVVLASALAVGPATTAAQENRTFIVEQGDTCVQVTPLGNGSQSVGEFYDYRSPVTEPEGLYSSYGTTDIQRSQVSQLFIYRGSEGLSLVFLHDEFGDESGGFVATADISGLPAGGEWPVEDDTYNNRDDVFNHSNGSSHIEWTSNGNRTDGAAFRGLASPNYTTITVDMAFNEEAERYPFEKWSGPPEQNRIEEWVVRSGTGETTELDMSQPVEISPGTCSGGVSTFTAQGGLDDTTTTSTGTTAPTATATQTTTETPTTQTAAETPEATPTAQSDESTPTTTGTGGLVGTTGGSGSDGTGTSGVFGPGFGPGVALVAVVALTVAALARRNG